MARRHKVKRYYGENASSFRAKPRLITIALIIVLFAGLGYLGTVIYKPAYDFIMNIGKTPATVQEEPEPEESEAHPEEQAEPEPDEKPVYKAVKAVYAPPGIVSDPARFDSFLDGLDSSAVTAVMIDVKNSEGEILFKSKNEMANKWDLITPDAVDLAEIAEKLEAKGLMLAAKMSVFRDPKAASAGRLDYAINYSDSNLLWLDNSAENGGRPWLNPYSSLTREYIASIMTEVIDAGAGLVALEDVRFPDNSAVYASFGAEAQGISRAQVLKSVIIELTKLAGEKSAQVAAYFPVIEVTNTELEANRYGGGILETTAGFIMPGVLLPQFGEGYSSGGLEVAAPLSNSAATVKTALSYVKQGVPPDTKLIPVLEGGNRELIASQIAALNELGIEEYVLYELEGRYEF